MALAARGLTRGYLRTSAHNRIPVVPSDVRSGPAGGTRPVVRRRWWKPLAGLTAAVALAAGGYYQPWKKLSAAPVVAPESAQVSRSVTIDRPTRAATTSVTLPATVRPWQSTTLHARVSGYLAAWHRDLGERVAAGELLAEIAAPELDQEVAQGAAQLGEAQAAVVQARAERIEAEADLKVAEAQFVRVQAETELARSQLVRRERLLASRSVSQEEYETTMRQVEAREADVAAVKSEISRRRANLETRAAIVKAREATATSRQANLDRLKELQRFERILAPFDGIVTRRTAEVGMLVTAGTDALFVVEDLSRVRVQVNVPQTYAAQTVPGAAAVIRLPESTAAPAEAMITRVAESVDAASRTMLAEIELENGAHRFQPGSYAQVALATAQEDSAWTIPTNTLSMRVDGPHVAVVNDQSRIEIRRVSLGRDLGARVVAVEGIRGNEELVVNPGDDLADGVLIRVAKRDGSRELASR